VNGKFNPKVDSFKDLKLLKASEMSNLSGSNTTAEGSPCGLEDLMDSSSSSEAEPCPSLEAGGRAVPPLYTVQGVRDYACSLCPGLIFHLLEGPGSVKEHLALIHAD
jgi:hypothetical protein